MSNQKRQVVVIHGGNVFDTYEDYFAYLRDEKEPRFETMGDKDWKDTLQRDLGEDFAVIQPSMPNKQNAKYAEWKIWFEKHIPHLQDEIILVGHSLGGVFLVKYLSDNDFPTEISATFLVSAPFDAMESEYDLGNFVAPDDLSRLRMQGGDIYIYHSKDDPVVDFADAEKYADKLPEAQLKTFTDKGHFNADLPEIVEDIKKI